MKLFEYLKKYHDCISSVTCSKKTFLKLNLACHGLVQKQEDTVNFNDTLLILAKNCYNQ